MEALRNRALTVGIGQTFTIFHDEFDRAYSTGRSSYIAVTLIPIANFAKEATDSQVARRATVVSVPPAPEVRHPKIIIFPLSMTISVVIGVRTCVVEFRSVNKIMNYDMDYFLTTILYKRIRERHSGLN